MNKRQKILSEYDKNSFQDLVNRCKSKGELVNILQLSVSGSSYKIIQEFIDKWDIDTSSLLGRKWNKGKSFQKKYTTKDLLNNNVYMSTNALKKRLIREKILKEKCYICNCDPIWNGKLLILHLDHIDGNRFNNNLNNLRILCPNCHSQTNTYCSRNKN